MKKSILYLPILFMLLVSNSTYAMGDLHVYPQFEKNRYLSLDIDVDCSGCWWNETAYIKGTVTLVGDYNQTININKTMPVYKGTFNKSNVELLTLSNPYSYRRVLVTLRVSGANTSDVIISENFPIR